MHKSFYASGFLYSLKTHKILLLQSEQKDDQASVWSTIGGESKGGEDARATFQRIISELLNLNLKEKNIFPVYDYFHDKLDKINYVFYGEVGADEKFVSPKHNTFSWLGFAETIKLLFPAHTKQDLIVGERVVNAKWRLSQGF